jgi:uncharacterized membrane protein YeaQ/YmgE (transglycosylase-associated protein family)
VACTRLRAVSTFRRSVSRQRVFYLITGNPVMSIGELIVWILVGGFAGTLAGRAATLKKEGLGRWTNLLVGMAGAVIGGELFRLLGIDCGLGQLKVTFEDLIAAFLGSLLVIVAWRFIAKTQAQNAQKRREAPKP